MNDKIWATMNVSLVLVALILTLTLFEVELPTLGQAKYALDKSEPLCIVNWQDSYNEWNDLDSCCVEARKQLDCSEGEWYYQDKTVEWQCKTGSGNVLKYWLNDKAYNYCRQLNIWG